MLWIIDGLIYGFFTALYTLVNQHYKFNGICWESGAGSEYLFSFCRFCFFCRFPMMLIIIFC